MNLNELQSFLIDNSADFEIIKHDKPIIKTSDAAQYFDVNKAAPVLIIETEHEMVAVIASAQRGRLDLAWFGQNLGFSKFIMADRGKAKEITGYDAGAIPLIGHGLPSVFDTKLLEEDHIYGGTGDALHTLKISPYDVCRLNKVNWEI